MDYTRTSDCNDAKKPSTTSDAIGIPENVDHLPIRVARALSIDEPEPGMFNPGYALDPNYIVERFKKQKRYVRYAHNPNDGFSINSANFEDGAQVSGRSFQQAGAKQADTPIISLAIAIHLH